MGWNKVIAGQLGDRRYQHLVEPVGPGVVEVRGDRRVHREVLIGDLERLVISLVLLAHLTQGIFGSPAVGLVDDDQIGEVEHVDLLQLAGRSVLGSHHVHGDVGVVDDLGVGLPDARRLQDDQIEPSSLDQIDGRRDVRGEGQVGLPGGKRPHERPFVADRVHSDPVAEKGTSGSAPRRVDRNDRHRAIGEIGKEAQNHLVDERALARSPGAGYADHRGVAPRRRQASLRHQLAIGVVLHDRDHPSQQSRCRCGQRGDIKGGVRIDDREVGLLDQVVDHALKAESAPIIG